MNDQQRFVTNRRHTESAVSMGAHTWKKGPATDLVALQRNKEEMFAAQRTIFTQAQQQLAETVLKKDQIKFETVKQMLLLDIGLKKLHEGYVLRCGLENMPKEEAQEFLQIFDMAIYHAFKFKNRPDLLTKLHRFTKKLVRSYLPKENKRAELHIIYPDNLALKGRFST